MLFDLFFYFFFSSVVLIYGIGLNRITVIPAEPKKVFLLLLKMLITVSSTSVLTFLFSNSLLAPNGLIELFPLIAVLIFISISIFIEAIIRTTSKINSSEFAVSFLCIILAVNESNSVLQCFITGLISIGTFFALIPVLYSLKKRIEITHPANDFKNSSLILISIAVLVISLISWNVSWLNPGVIK